MLIPAKLQAGATIGITGPASPMIEARLSSGISYLENLGYRIKIGKSVGRVLGYLGGSDQERADDLNAMFGDPDVQAVFCTRGGYGTPRILDLVDYELIRAHGKIFVGYSDITALQLAMYAKVGLVTYSGPMVAVEMGKGIDNFTESHFWPMISDSRASFKLEAQRLAKDTSARPSVQGTLLGGNLSLLAALVGTNYLPDLTGSILVLEDIGEEPYQVDRKLTQLRLAGLLDGLAGIVLGQFTDCEPSTENSLTMEQIFTEIAGRLNLPVLVDLPYGHIDRKYTLPFGYPATLNHAESCIEIIPPVTA